MKLLFKQRFFSWFDSYDIFGEDGRILYTVKGKLAWGHKLQIYDSVGRQIGTVRERIISLFPAFELYEGDRYLGCVRRKLSFLKPRYEIDFKGWKVSGNFLEWDYQIYGAGGELVATVDKEIFNWTDTYVIDVKDPADALYCLMFTLAVDAEKCSRNN